MLRGLYLAKILLILIIFALSSKIAISTATTTEDTNYQILLYCIDISNKYKITENSAIKYYSIIRGNIKIKLYIFDNNTVNVKLVDNNATINENGLKQKLEAYLSKTYSGGGIYYSSDLSRTISMQKGPYFTFSLVLLNSTVDSESHETRPVYPQYYLLIRLYTPIQSPDSFIHGVESLFNQVKERRAPSHIGHISIDFRYGDASLKILRTNDTIGYTVKSSFHNDKTGISYNGEETTIYSYEGWLVGDNIISTMVTTHGSRQDESKNRITIVLCNSTVPGVSPYTNSIKSLQSEAGAGENMLSDKVTIGLVFGIITLAVVGVWFLKTKT